MAFAGDLQSISLPDIFQNLSQNERTGRLRIQGEAEAYDLLFRSGKVVGVESARQGVDEYLLGVLRKRGNISSDEFSRIQKKIRPPAGPVSTAVKLKYITQRDADELLGYYVTERVLDMFSVDRGTFEFIEGEEGFKNVLSEWEQFPRTVEAEKLLFEAARRGDEWAEIKKKIISADEIFASCINIRESVREGIDGDDLQIFVNIDGMRTLKEVVNASRESKFTVYRSVARLLENKMIMPLQAGQTVKLAQSLFEEGNFLKCIEVARKGLSVERNNPTLRHLLARSLAKTHQEGKAAEELKLLALSLLDEGNPRKAIDVYREVVDFVPSDIDARQRIFDLRLDLSTDEGIEEGRAFVQALREFGLNDRARDILRLLMDIAPDDVDILNTYGEVNLDLGDKIEAVKTFHSLAERLTKGEYLEEAAQVYRKIIQVQPGDDRAARLLGELEEGVFEKKEQKRRLVRRIAGAAVCLSLLIAWVVYDFVARAAYVDMNRKAAHAMADKDFASALDTVETFREDYPFTTSQASARDYSWTLRVLASLIQARDFKASGQKTKAQQWLEDALGKARNHLDEEDPLVGRILKEQEDLKGPSRP